MAATSALSEPAKENETTVRIFMSRRLQDPCARHLPQASQFLLPAFPKRITYRERCAVKTPNQVEIASRESLREADQQRVPVKGKLFLGWQWATCQPGVAEVAGSESLLPPSFFNFPSTENQNHGFAWKHGEWSSQGMRGPWDAAQH